MKALGFFSFATLLTTGAAVVSAEAFIKIMPPNCSRTIITMMPKIRKYEFLAAKLISRS